MFRPCQTSSIKLGRITCPNSSSPLSNRSQLPNEHPTLGNIQTLSINPFAEPSWKTEAPPPRFQVLDRGLPSCIIIPSTYSSIAQHPTSNMLVLHSQIWFTESAKGCMGCLQHELANWKLRIAASRRIRISYMAPLAP